jgi:hypothetical protein
MRVMVFSKAAKDVDMNAEPSAEMLEAFAAMDRFTEELAAPRDDERGELGVA